MTESSETNTPDDEPTAGKSSSPSDTWEEIQAEHKGSCPYPCPFCMGVTFMDQLSPEVGEHLMSAGKELMAAAKKFFEAVSQTPETEEVERIPFD